LKYFEIMKIKSWGFW